MWYSIKRTYVLTKKADGTAMPVPVPGEGEWNTEAEIVREERELR